MAANAGYKNFGSEVLTSSDVDTYLMQQTIMTFADATARDAAITAPVEGMHAYLADSNSVTYYDGAAWVSLVSGYGVGDLSNVDTASIAAGSVLYYNGTNFVNLGVGTAAQVLTVNAGATAPEWADAGGGTDRVVVSGFCTVQFSVGGPAQITRVITDTVDEQIPFVPDRAGSIVGISASLLSARTAGTSTFEVFKNGSTTGLTCVADASTPQYPNTSQAAGLDTFVAGDRIDVRISNASFSPSSNAGEAFVVLEYNQ